MCKVILTIAIGAIFSTSGFAAPVKKSLAKQNVTGLTVPALDCDITDVSYAVPGRRDISLGFYFGDDGKPVLIVRKKDRQSHFMLRETGGGLTATHNEDLLLVDNSDPVPAKHARPFSMTALVRNTKDGLRTWTGLPDLNSAPPGVIFIPELGASLYGQAATALPPLTGRCLDTSGADDK